jgi:hypothetical protein
MPPYKECPNCLQVVEDWQVEWYKSEGPLLYKGLAAMDCPICGQRVGFQQGIVGRAPAGARLVRRYADKAAEWAAGQAIVAGKTLQGYLTTAGAGVQYANYWTMQAVQQADIDEQAKQGGP